MVSVAGFTHNSHHCEPHSLTLDSPNPKMASVPLKYHCPRPFRKLSACINNFITFKLCHEKNIHMLDSPVYFNGGNTASGV